MQRSTVAAGFHGSAEHHAQGKIMSLWYVVAIGLSFGVSWVVSNVYSDHCRCTERHLRHHGALEFNLTLFSLFMFTLAYAANNVFFVLIGGALAFILARRFWVNWSGSEQA